MFFAKNLIFFASACPSPSFYRAKLTDHNSTKWLNPEMEPNMTKTDIQLRYCVTFNFGKTQNMFESY